jgi:hypothetical protein
MSALREDAFIFEAQARTLRRFSRRLSSCKAIISARAVVHRLAGEALDDDGCSAAD